MVLRMLQNLLNLARNEGDVAAALRYLDTTVAIEPTSAEARGMRAGLRHRQGDRDGAIADLDWLLENKPEGVDLERVRQFKRILLREER